MYTDGCRAVAARAASPASSRSVRSGSWHSTTSACKPVCQCSPMGGLGLGRHPPRAQGTCSPARSAGSAPRACSVGDPYVLPFDSVWRPNQVYTCSGRLPRRARCSSCVGISDQSGDFKFYFTVKENDCVLELSAHLQRQAAAQGAMFQLRQEQRPVGQQLPQPRRQRVADAAPCRQRPHVHEPPQRRHRLAAEQGKTSVVY